MTEYLRFTRNQRAQHLILLITFLLLVVTGLPMKYRYEAGRPLIEFLGFVTLRSLHKWAAIAMTAVGIYHVGWYLLVDRGEKKLFPQRKDLTDFGKFIKFNLGHSEEYPKFDRFNFVQKFDYWGAFWGMAIMILTGAQMWHTDWFTFLPLWIRESMRIAHSEEALLAAAFIFTVHIYQSHLRAEVRPLDPVFLTGTLSEERIKEEHPLEYDEWKRREA
jgi:formate dehydrogenase gamma subunit